MCVCVSLTSKPACRSCRKGSMRCYTHVWLCVLYVSHCNIMWFFNFCRQKGQTVSYYSATSPKTKEKGNVGEKLEEATAERCKKHAQKYHADLAADKEESKQQLILDRQAQVEKDTHAVAMEQMERLNSIKVTEALYEQKVELGILTSSAVHHNTRPLLLDAVVTPLSEESPSQVNYTQLLAEARKERDNALLTAKQWRNCAEKIQAEKRELKNSMEKTLEIVRANQSCRGRLMCREDFASLIRK